MNFTGRIFYDFETIDVWRVYSTFLKASQTKGVTIDVSWEEFLVGDPDPDRKISSKTRGLAACAAVREAHPDQHQRFVRAMLTMAYDEKDDPGKDVTLAVAARVAGLDGGEVIARAIDPGLELLKDSSIEAKELGFANVPTIVRQGPPVYVKTTSAAAYGSAVRRLELINRMLDDDGIWTLSKP